MGVGNECAANNLSDGLRQIEKLTRSTCVVIDHACNPRSASRDEAVRTCSRACVPGEIHASYLRQPVVCVVAMLKLSPAAAADAETHAFRRQSRRGRVWQLCQSPVDTRGPDVISISDTTVVSASSSSQNTCRRNKLDPRKPYQQISHT